MAGTEIRSITARQVYTNRGNPGVEAVVTTENGATGRAMCTSGISIGTHEIHFDFDGGERFRGKGVLGAVRNVNEIIAPALKGLDAVLLLLQHLFLLPNAHYILFLNEILQKFRLLFYFLYLV